VAVPPRRESFAGRPALASEEEIPTVSAALVTRFQFASAALTVTLNGTPAICGKAAPVLPVGVPGAGVSPGRRISSLAKARALTAPAGLVLAGMAECVTLDAVMVALPAVLSVPLKLLEPFVSAVLAGRTAFASVEVMATVSFVLTTFQ